MDVLAIGGSVFLGRAVVAEALAAGHTVTVFNRGVSGSEPEGVNYIRGDRTQADDLQQLAGQHFDLVVDTCGYVPTIVGLSVTALADAADHYAFVSSINAYPGWPEAADYHVGGVYDGDPDASEAPAELTDAGPYDLWGVPSADVGEVERGPIREVRRPVSKPRVRRRGRPVPMATRTGT